MTPAELHARVLAAADAEGRLPLPPMANWETFPFESASLRVVPLAPPELPEPLRDGEGGQACEACTGSGRDVVWSDDHWRLSRFGEPTGAPVVLLLETWLHYDLPDLPDDLACQFGVVTAHITRAIEQLPHIARAHVSRWGDGNAHMHVWFFARPAGFPQLRGTCMAIWDEILPPPERSQIEADTAAIAAALVQSYGGTAAS
jgi:hypothetical protein